MIKSFVVTPNFLKILISNELLLKEFKEFYLTVKNKVFREILFLIDDEKENYREQYQIIAKEIAGKNNVLFYLIQDFLLKSKFEKIDLKSYSPTELDIDFFFDEAKDIQNPVEINIPYQSLPTTEEKLKNCIQKFTKYAEKIIIFDPYIAQHMTNFSAKGISEIRSSMSKIKKAKEYQNFEIKIMHKCNHKASIRKILELILINNKEKNLKIEILSPIQDKDQNIFHKILKEIQEYKKDIDMRLEENENDTTNNENNKENKKVFLLKEKENINDLFNSIYFQMFSKDNNEPFLERNISNKILKCFQNIKWNDYKINLKIVNEYGADDNNHQFYRKGILVNSKNNNKIVMCFGKGIDIYEDFPTKKEPKLRKSRGKDQFHLEIITDPVKKKQYTTPTRFNSFTQKTLNI